MSNVGRRARLETRQGVCVWVGDSLGKIVGAGEGRAGVFQEFVAPLHSACHIFNKGSHGPCTLGGGYWRGFKQHQSIMSSESASLSSLISFFGRQATITRP